MTELLTIRNENAMLVIKGTDRFKIVSYLFPNFPAFVEQRVINGLHRQAALHTERMHIDRYFRHTPAAAHYKLVEIATEWEAIENRNTIGGMIKAYAWYRVRRFFGKRAT